MISKTSPVEGFKPLGGIQLESVSFVGELPMFPLQHKIERAAAIMEDFIFPRGTELTLLFYEIKIQMLAFNGKVNISPY